MKILIVDDSPSVLALLGKILSDKNHEVLLAKTGEEGIEQAKEHCPDIVIIDTILPDIFGFEVCESIRKNQGEKIPKIVVTTGSIDAIDAVRARQMGADDYCVKNKDFAYLLKVVDNLIKGV